jgi:hypothetical protein
MCSLFGHFTQLVSDASGWAYAIVFLLALRDDGVEVTRWALKRRHASSG